MSLVLARDLPIIGDQCGFERGEQLPWSGCQNPKSLAKNMVAVLHSRPHHGDRNEKTNASDGRTDQHCHVESK